MFIQEALAKAKHGKDHIYRRSWMHRAVIFQTIVVGRVNGELYKRICIGAEPWVSHWTPTVEDLCADDWELIPVVRKENETRRLERWLGIGHQDRCDDSGDN